MHMTCLSISNNQLGQCNKKPKQCVICAKIYKTKNHKYNITRYITKKKKICIYVIPKYVNYGCNYQTITFKYLARQKILALVWKNKDKKTQDKNNGRIVNERS